MLACVGAGVGEVVEVVPPAHATRSKVITMLIRASTGSFRIMKYGLNMVLPSAKLLQLGQQIIQSVDEIHRVIQLLAHTEDRLIEENVSPVGDMLLILLIA